MGQTRELSPIGALFAALQAGKIKFIVIGMTAAIIQGAPGVTLDTDLWVQVPERQYMRLINLSLGLGATMVRQTVVALTDGKLVNFCYGISGAASFTTEYRRAELIEWEGAVVRVLPLLRDIAASRKKLRIRR